jgi:hypothetical protein
MVRAVTALIVIVIVGLSASACSGSASKSTGPTIATHSAPHSGGGEVPTSTPGSCPYAEPALITTAFAAKVTAINGGTSGIGNATCQFTLASTNVGSPGSVLLSLNPGSTAAKFSAARAAAAGLAVTGTGDMAFYVPTTTTLQVQKKAKLLVIQAVLHASGQAQAQPAVVKADLIALGRAIAATL